MSNVIPPRPASYDDAQRDPLPSLLRDLQALSDYLHARGQRTFETARQFADHARASVDTRAYDERQATMLEYQHQVWMEIAGLVDRLATRYGEIAADATDTPPDKDEDHHAL